MLVTVASAVLVQALGLEDLVDGLVLGLVVGIGYSTAVSVNNAVSPNTPRPLLLGAVAGSYHVVGALAVFTIVVALR